GCSTHCGEAVAVGGMVVPWNARRWSSTTEPPTVAACAHGEQGRSAASASPGAAPAARGRVRASRRARTPQVLAQRLGAAVARAGERRGPLERLLGARA